MRTILIVDDDESFREMLRTFMETRGIEVLTAANTGEALEIAACRDVDAILSDYQMPTMDGLAFCRELRTQSARLDRRVPVWLMTGSPTLTEREGIAAGAEGVFRKPFRVLEITTVIERHLKPIEMHASVGNVKHHR